MLVMSMIECETEKSAERIEQNERAGKEMGTEKKKNLPPKERDALATPWFGVSE